MELPTLSAAQGNVRLQPPPPPLTVVIDNVLHNFTTNITRHSAANNNNNIHIDNQTYNLLDVNMAATVAVAPFAQSYARFHTTTAAPFHSTVLPSFIAAEGAGSAADATSHLVEATFDLWANFSSIINASDARSNATLPADTLFIEDDEIRLGHAPQLSHSTMIKVYVLTVMAVLSLFGNILTMWNIYKTRITRRSSRHSWSAIYSLIFHLSIADVLVTGFCIIGEAAWSYTVQWMADELTCKMVKLFQMFSLYLSTYVLVLIGVDRWIAVKYPMKSLNMAKRCYRLLGGTYILSLLLSLPQFFIFHLARGPFIEEFYQCVTHGFYTAPWQEQFYATFTLVFTFLLPLCILFITYLSSFCTISSSEKMFQGSKLATYSNKPAAQTNRQRLIHKAKMKSLRISVVIIIAFIVCWTPYYVMMIIFMFLNPDKRLSEGLNSAIFAFGMSNSLVNPLIYGAFHLCPMKRKASRKGGNNNAYSLNRGDSQRTPSMLTAVTQIDGNGRQVRTYRQPSYYRTHSNGSNSKEHVSLLQVTPTPTLMRKSNSLRSPHYIPQYHTHSSSLVCNGNGAGSGSGDNGSHATVIYNYNNHRSSGGVSTRANSSDALGLSGGGCSASGNHVINSRITTNGGNGLQASLGLHSGKQRYAANESVSSV